MLPHQGNSSAWTKRTRGLDLRQGRSRDRLQINWLWNHAAYRHRIPGQEQQAEMLVRTPNVLWSRNGQLCGAMFISQLRAPVADVRQIVLLESSERRAWVETVLPAFADRCARLGLEWFSLNDCSGWLEEVLPQAGFAHAADVVSLALEGWQNRSVPSHDVTCRRASLADTEAVLRIDREAFGPFWRMNRKLVRQSLDTAAYKLVLGCDHVPVAYLFAERWPSEVYISRVGVLPERQGQGLGHLIMQQALERIARDDVNRVSLNTQSDNNRSMRLYTALGFEPTGHVSTFWSRDLSAEKDKDYRYIPETAR